MSDDRIFASNSAIGRKWYYLNLIILFVIAAFTNYFFQNFVFTGIKTDAYKLIATGIEYFVFVLYLITFFSLIDRRIYDIAGSRSSDLYKSLSLFMSTVIFFQLAIIIMKVFSLTFVYTPEFFQNIANILDIIFLLVVVIIGLIKGKISVLSYSEYRKLSKYDD